MPHWVSAGGRSGAVPPPPPPSRPEPDYEVIEFPSDQYVNAKLNPAPRITVSQHCGLCGAPGARTRCLDCEGRVFCLSCDDMYHRHPKRRAHRRQPLAAGPTSEDSERPPLPPKAGQAAPPPVPPPRRNKVGGRSDSFSSRSSRTPPPPGPHGAPPTPAHLRRPLPAAPIPPHLKHNSIATSNGPEANSWTRPSTATSFASPPASPRPPHLTHEPQAWPPGGGGWSATMDRRRSAGVGAPPAGEGALRRAPIASSVFELHRPEAYPHQHPLQQQRFLPAQSMATLSCASCAGCQQQRAAAAAAGGDWWRYGSNASLDARVPHEAFSAQAPPGGMWVNPWLPPMPMYPHTHHTTGRPSSRTHSRAVSRAASPAASVRSRRSRHAARRYREPDDYSDDEDSSDERRAPRRRDSLRSAPAHTTPPPVSREAPAPQRQDLDRDSTQRRGVRRDSTSSYAHRESPVRTHAPKEAERVPPTPTGSRETPRVLSPPPNNKEVGASPTLARFDSSDEPSPETDVTVAQTSAPDVLDAPLPPVPTARWQCEYCTYVNEPGTRVCEICCKTLTAPPQPASSERASPAPAERPTPGPAKRATPAPAERDTPAPAERLTAATKRLAISESTSPTPLDRATDPPKKGEDDYMNVRVDKAQDETEPPSGGVGAAAAAMEANSLGVKRVKKKTFSEKVSTGCGPSPPRDAPPSPTPTPASAPAAPVTPGTTSTGTSPLPQSISTQTYESPEEVRQAAASTRPTSSTADESSRSTRRRSARSLRREARRSSRRSPEHTSRSERSHSRHSFSSDTRSIGTPAREWSPAPAAAPDEDWWREAGPLRSRSNSLMQQQRPHTTAQPRRAPPRRASHLDLYRERDDPRWRRADPFGDPYAYPDPRQEAYGSQPDVTRAISLETLAAARRQTDAIRSQGMELVKLLREAEASGFTAEEVHAATQQCGSTEPVRWLQENWSGMVASVQTVASKLGREAGEGDTVGTLSEREAREALRRHKGSVWQAVTDCVQQRQRKYGELMSRGKFSREEVLTCLTAHHGDLEAAYLDLTKNQLKPFLMKIWGPPEGVENDSANPNPRAGPSGALTSLAQPSGNQKAEDVNVTYLDKLKKFETILNKDANVHADDSVSENNNRFAENSQVPPATVAPTMSVQITAASQDNTADILGGLKSLLIRAGIPVSEQALLTGLKKIMNMGDKKTQTSQNITKSDVNQNKDLIETENDFIQAYNALTSSSPLPSIGVTSENKNIEQYSQSIENVSISSDYIAQSDKDLSHQSNQKREITAPMTDTKEERDNSNSNGSKSVESDFDERANTTSSSHLNSNKISTTEESLASNSEKRSSERSVDEVVNSRIDQTQLSKTPITSQESRQQHHQESNTHVAMKHQILKNNHDEENGDERGQHLSDIVNDTHRLIQQMKDEINSDMASYDEGGQDSDSENESSVTPDSSERDSYTENSESSSGDEDEASDELTIEESDDKYNKNKAITSISPEQITSSDENEQFEEAIDNSESLNSHYEQSNMAALDAIVRSLQEIDSNIVRLEPEVTSQAIIDREIVFVAQIDKERENYENERKRIVTEAAIGGLRKISPIHKAEVEEEAGFVPELEVVENTVILSKPEVTTEATILTEPDVIIESAFITTQEIQRNSVSVSEPKDTTEADTIIEPNVTREVEFVAEPKVARQNGDVHETEISLENNIENDSEVTTEINEDSGQQDITEDYNNNLLTIKTFEELYESLSSNQPIFSNINEYDTTNNRSPTPEVVISENIEPNQAHVPNKLISIKTQNNYNNDDISPNSLETVAVNNNKEIHTDDSNINTNISMSDISNVNSNDNNRVTPDKVVSTISNHSITSKDKQINLTRSSEPSESINKKTTKIANDTDKIQTKSNIPKPKTSNINGPNKGENRPPTKVIISKVPIRRNSLKQPTSPPTSQKSHFGNIQSGHVKKLQSSLFDKNDKNPKIPVPVRKKTPPKSGLALVKPMPSKIITIQSDNSADKAKLKPYFQETCLSDDYLTETDDEAGKRARSTPRAKSMPAEATVQEPEPEPLPITSRLVNGKIVDFTEVLLKDGSPERQVRMLVAEGVVETWQQAEVAVALAARGEPPAAALLAAHDCADLPAAIAYLKQECELCAGHAPAYEMVSMLACTHRCCSECARTYFTVQITERSIFDCVCPFCKLPELAAADAASGADQNDDEDEALEYFSRLEHLLRSVVETGVHELFQRKLRDRALLQDPNFKWCVECSSGFFVHPRQKRLTCPECRSVTCARCRKPWEKQHEGLSCDQFAEWKEANDPESSLAAVQRHLQDNGIDCPKCKFRYSLARGGCMHFTCSQCKYEFCCGCGKPFTMGARCGLSEYCAKLGLHSHHPRNCLFYLRDKEPHQLQTLLQMNNVEYKTEPADCGEEAAAAGEASGEKRPRRCPVPLQRETPAGLVDITCNGDVPPRHAGLCKSHYLEYLAGVVMARGVDPLPVMDLSELVAELRRRALPLPERGPWDTDPLYAGMCAEIVKEKIPLE